MNSNEIFKPIDSDEIQKRKSEYEIIRKQKADDERNNVLKTLGIDSFKPGDIIKIIDSYNKIFIRTSIKELHSELSKNEDSYTIIYNPSDNRIKEAWGNYRNILGWLNDPKVTIKVYRDDKLIGKRLSDKIIESEENIFKPASNKEAFDRQLKYGQIQLKKIEQIFNNGQPINVGDYIRLGYDLLLYKGTYYKFVKIKEINTATDYPSFKCTWPTFNYYTATNHIKYNNKNIDLNKSNYLYNIDFDDDIFLPHQSRSTQPTLATYKPENYFKILSRSEAEAEIEQIKKSAKSTIVIEAEENNKDIFKPANESDRNLEFLKRVKMDNLDKVKFDIITAAPKFAETMILDNNYKFSSLDILEKIDNKATAANQWSWDKLYNKPIYFASYNITTIQGYARELESYLNGKLKNFHKVYQDINNPYAIVNLEIPAIDMFKFDINLLRATLFENPTVHNNDYLINLIMEHCDVKSSYDENIKKILMFAFEYYNIALFNINQTVIDDMNVVYETVKDADRIIAGMLNENIFKPANIDNRQSEYIEMIKSKNLKDKIKFEELYGELRVGDTLKMEYVDKTYGIYKVFNFEDIEVDINSDVYVNDIKMINVPGIILKHLPNADYNLTLTWSDLIEKLNSESGIWKVQRYKIIREDIDIFKPADSIEQSRRNKEYRNVLIDKNIKNRQEFENLYGKINVGDKICIEFKDKDKTVKFYTIIKILDAFDYYDHAVLERVTFAEEGLEDQIINHFVYDWASMLKLAREEYYKSFEVIHKNIKEGIFEPASKNDIESRQQIYINKIIKDDEISLEKLKKIINPLKIGVIFRVVNKQIGIDVEYVIKDLSIKPIKVPLLPNTLINIYHIKIALLKKFDKYLYESEFTISEFLSRINGYDIIVKNNDK